jgi:hypothetical protein
MKRLNFQKEFSAIGLLLSVKHALENIFAMFFLVVLAATAADDVAHAAGGEATTRFVISADKTTVQDNETGLAWQRVVTSDGFTWEGAFNYCKSLKLAQYKNDWRLPTLKELQSLITEPKKPSLMYINSIAFPHTPSEFFWTASANDTDVAAIFFDMSKFPTGLGPNRSLGHVRCVRGTLSTIYKVPEASSYNLMTIPRQVAQ